MALPLCPRRTVVLWCLITAILAQSTTPAADPLPGRTGPLTLDDVCDESSPGNEDCALGALQRASVRRIAKATGGEHAEAGKQVQQRQSQRMQSQRQRHGIKVIGAGLPKTGTSSLKVALQRLGYHAVHGEFLDLSQFSHLWPEWEHGDPWPALNCMLDMGFDATMDRPWCWAYKELLSLYPDAKVILSHYPRGGAKGWADATEKWTVNDRKDPLGFYARVWNSTPGKHFSTGMYSQLHGCLLGYPVDDGSMPQETKDNCEKGYTKWYDEVIATVPPEQLLVYNVTQGWEPLCSFLEVADCPTEVFPHVEVGRMVLKEALDDILHPGKDTPSLPLSAMRC